MHFLLSKMSFDLISELCPLCMAIPLVLLVSTSLLSIVFSPIYSDFHLDSSVVQSTVPNISHLTSSFHFCCCDETPRQKTAEGRKQWQVTVQHCGRVGSSLEQLTTSHPVSSKEKMNADAFICLVLNSVSLLLIGFKDRCLGNNAPHSGLDRITYVINRQARCPAQC